MIKQQIAPVIAVALSVLFLTACADFSSQATIEPETSVESQATATPEAITAEAVATEAVATEAAVSEEAILVPTAEPVAEPAVESVDWTQTASIDGAYYILGNPAAPIRLVDYSDFM